MSGEEKKPDTQGMTPWPTGAGGKPTTGERSLLAGRYEILGLVGSGGMGSVYRAFDRELEEVVALKTLREGLTATPHLLERFRREVKLARRVTHPNVARTFDIGDHGQEKFLTMEYVDGESLSTLIAREGRLPVARVAAIAGSVCAGLSAAHAVGVVHRDLKPDNVLIEKSGRIVITDFGIACAHQDPSQLSKTLGGVVGTPAYMAPEQVEGAPDVDERADVYALGVMMFEMLTGKMPFEGVTPFAVASARLSKNPPNPRSLDASVGETIAQVVMRCMAKRREDRFQTTAEVAALLGAHAPTLGAGPVSIRPPPGWQPPEPDADTKSGEKTVAVLPFRNAGPSDDEYMAEGLTEDLIDTLSMTPGLRVRPLSTVMTFKERGGDPREVGNALGVEVVVDGSLRRMGEMLRIAARLISVRDGFQLWAKRFDRPRSDVLVVSDEAAHSIAEALTAKAVSPVREAPTDSQAIDLYLQGRRELRKVWSKPVRRAAELFAQAQARAPRDSAFLAAHAYARARLWYYEGGIEEGRMARELAERALAEAPERGEACLALAEVRFVEQDFEAAAPLVKRALDRSPQLAEAHQLLGEILIEVGDPEDAIKSFRTALALDPELRSGYFIARADALLGRWTEVEALLSLPAEDEWSQSVRISTGHRLALWSDALKGYAAKLEMPETAEDLLPVRYARGVREAIITGTFTEATRAFMDEQLAQPDPAPRFGAFKHVLAAEILAYVGETQLALTHLEALLRGGFWDKNWLELCPVLRGVREEPRFAELHGRVAERAERVQSALR